MVNLYNSERERVTTIEPAELERTRVVCVTRDDFGPLAVNLSLLLEKNEENLACTSSVSTSSLQGKAP